MPLHEVQLKGYSARPGNLSLGTFGSLHIDYTTAVNEIAALKTNKADKTELETVKQQVTNITPDDNGLLDEADIAEVETLAQAYYDAVDGAPDEEG